VRAFAVTLGVAACYSPHPQTGASCPSGQCPDPLVCSPATQTCELVAIDASTAHDAPIDSPVPIDAMRDAPIDAAPTAMLVQQAVAHADTPSLTVSLPAQTKAGDVLVMIGADEHGPLSSVSGGGVGSWVHVVDSTINTNIEIWYGVVTVGSMGPVTLVGPPLATQPIFANVSEWSGLITPNPSDGARAASGLTSPADPGAIATAHAHDLVFFGVGDQVPNTFGAPAPGNWTSLTPIVADITMGAWYRTVTVAGLVHPTVSETDGHWDAAVAAFAIAP